MPINFNFFKKTNFWVEAEKERQTLLARSAGRGIEIYSQLTLLDNKIKAGGSFDTQWKPKNRLRYPMRYFKAMKRVYELKNEINAKLEDIRKTLDEPGQETELITSVKREKK